MESLLKHILKKIQQSTSKVIKSQIINSYHIYYFSQSSFLFVMATQSPTVVFLLILEIWADE